VVDQAVNHCGGDGVVAEDFSPAAEGFVGCDDDAGSFVAGGDELEEQVRCFGFEGQVADFVDDQQRDPAQAFEFVGEPAGVVGCGEAGDPVGSGGELDAVSGVAGLDRQAGGEVGFCRCPAGRGGSRSLGRR
jgi:hypothetical protein